MNGNAYVQTSYVFFWKTEETYRKVFAEAGLDMAAAYAALEPEKKLQIENRIFHATTR
jgi:hypothetical protein